MNEHTLGDALIEPKYVKMMNDLARFVDKLFNGVKRPRRTGFVLLVFDFGDKGRCNYISNANRDDVVVLLKEQIKRFEGQPDITGHA